MEQNFMECNTSMMKLASSFQAKAKHVMLTAPSVFDGRNLLAWMR
jgi:hypothetical protein